MRRARRTVPKAGRRRGRADARLPECLAGADVADAGEQALIEQHRLDRATTRRQRGAQPCRRDDGVGDLRPEFGQCGTGLQSRDAGECARIGQADDRAVVEHEANAFVARRRIAVATEPPVAGHAEVHVQHGAIVEVEQLVLAAALHAVHATAGQLRRRAVGELPALCVVQHRQLRDATAGDHLAQSPDGAFHFGLFRHAATSMRESCGSPDGAPAAGRR